MAATTKQCQLYHDIMTTRELPGSEPSRNTLLHNWRTPEDGGSSIRAIRSMYMVSKYLLHVQREIGLGSPDGRGLLHTASISRHILVRDLV
jgi:hypothetical protein